MDHEEGSYFLFDGLKGKTSKIQAGFQQFQPIAYLNIETEYILIQCGLQFWTRKGRNVCTMI